MTASTTNELLNKLNKAIELKTDIENLKEKQERELTEEYSAKLKSYLKELQVLWKL